MNILEKIERVLNEDVSPKTKSIFAAMAKKIFELPEFRDTSLATIEKAIMSIFLPGIEASKNEIRIIDKLEKLGYDSSGSFNDNKKFFTSFISAADYKSLKKY